MTTTGGHVSKRPISLKDAKMGQYRQKRAISTSCMLAGLSVGVIVTVVAKPVLLGVSAFLVPIGGGICGLVVGVILDLKISRAQGQSFDFVVPAATFGGLCGTLLCALLLCRTEGVVAYIPLFGMIAGCVVGALLQIIIRRR